MQPEHVRLPPPLRHGDCIGLFSPAGPVRDREKLTAGLRLLHELGFKTHLLPAEESSHEYLAAGDMQRADEFLSLWRNEEVHALMAVRGGYGCMRMMQYLELDTLKKNPKMVIGFSDVTVLLNILAERAGIMTVHGPVLTSLVDADQPSVNSFLSAVKTGFSGSMSFEDVNIVRGGTARGILRGGNLTTLTHLLGTPWEISMNGSLLILEDTGEPMYKIDRMLTQLYVSGRLERLAGLLLGTFDFTTNVETNMRLQEDIQNRVLELTANTTFPIWSNFPVGHLSTNQAMPIGLAARMDSSKKQIFTN